MGLLDVVKSRILIDYKVETDQAKAAVRGLAGEQKKAANEAIASMERQKQAHELMVSKMAAGVFIVAGAYSIAKRGVEAYEKSLIAAGEKGSASLEKMKKATEQADRAFNQLEIALGKIVVTAAPVIQQFADMATGLARIAGGIASVVEQASRLPGGGLIGSAVRNTWRVLPQGQLITAAGAGADWLGGGSTDSLYGDEESFARASSRYADTSIPGSGYASPQEKYNNQKDIEAIQARVDSTIRRANRAGKKARRGRGGRPTPKQPQLDLAALGQSALGYLGEGIGAVEQGLDDFGSMGTFYQPDEMDVLAERAKGQAADLQRFMDQLKAEQNETMLTRIFGPVEEFDAYASGFDLLKTSSQAAFQAWIDGSMGAGEAAKSAAIQVLTAEATKLLGQGLSSIGIGIVHSAQGNPKGPGEIGAGLKAVGQAGLIGSLAKGLGGSSVGATGVGGGGGFGGGGRPQETDNRNPVIPMGDDWSDEGPRWRARRFNRDMRNRDRHYTAADGGSHG